MKPSEYWERQVFYTHSINQRKEDFEDESYEQIPNMVFGTDIGHAEGWWPVTGFPEPCPRDLPDMFKLPVVPTAHAYQAIFGGLSASRMVPFLQDNFFRAYPNVDRNALKSVFERIAPTTAELGLV
jgi:hypothetical protein